MNFVIERIPGESTRPLRHEVLRHGHPYESTLFPGDDDPLAAHYGVVLVQDDGSREIVSVGTTYPDPAPWAPDMGNAWRIRGMATKPARRGAGLGRLVLDALVGHVLDHGGGLIWCHARVGALDFYRRAGFLAVSDIFDDGIALHQSMCLELGPRSDP